MPTAALRRTLATVFALFLYPGALAAKDQVKITDAAVGFPAARDGDRVAKFGAWAPVAVTLEPLGQIAEPVEVVFETADPDEVTAALAVPVDLANSRTVTGYVRLSGLTSEVTVTVRTAKGTALSEPFRAKVRPREPLQYVVLALGGEPAGFEVPKPGTAADAGPLRGGRIELARIVAVADLPARWVGYDAADLVVLNTGTAPEFLKELFAKDAPPAVQQKREALIEFVRRGGRIVTSIGASASLVKDLPELVPLLPLVPNPSDPGRTVPVLALVWPVGAAGTANTASGTVGGKGKAVAVANLIPRSEVSARVISPPARGSSDRPPVVAQAALGLGRTTVVGFDLDSAAFAEFQARPEFWDFLLRDAGAARASGGGDGKPRPPGVLTEDEDEAAVALRTHNDTFDGVAVLSFGWVALLIALYILVVGPLEYYFLKRILGRLELTWVTFPLIVLTASVLAYVSAASVKGRDLKVNKIDVVDVDPASDRVYGSAWWTVFSPRIDAYTATVTPNDGWAADATPEGTSVAVTGAPRAGRAGLSRRRYAQQPDALDGVPVQVWSTKAFSANWSAKLGTGRVTSDLRHPPGDPTAVIGTFRHDLPIDELTDCVAFYAGQAYPLPGGVLVRGAAVRVAFVQGEPAGQWLQTNGGLNPFLSRAQAFAERPGQKGGPAQAVPFTGPLPLWGLLFHEAALRNDEGTVARNASFRRLDQSWRFAPDHRDEVLVVGRSAGPVGPAEAVLGGPSSPSKLWLKGLPSAGERKPLPGTARQETWVRLYLPVR